MAPSLRGVSHVLDLGRKRGPLTVKQQAALTLSRTPDVYSERAAQGPARIRAAGPARICYR